jgi:hypothetical protein
MHARLCAVVAVLAAGSVALVPAHAATKKKPKPITKTYKVQLPPDPTGNVGTDGCAGALPTSQDQHPFTVPAKGTLKVHLSSNDPTGSGQLDWDLALLDADGGTISLSTSPGAEEETLDKFKKKEAVKIQACNLAGLPEATVTYTFTYA